MLGIDGAAQWLQDTERVTWFTTPAGMGVHIAPSALTPTVLENTKDPGSESALRDPSPEPIPLVCPLTEKHTQCPSVCGSNCSRKWRRWLGQARLREARVVTVGR